MMLKYEFLTMMAIPSIVLLKFQRSVSQTVVFLHRIVTISVNNFISLGKMNKKPPNVWSVVPHRKPNKLRGKSKTKCDKIEAFNDSDVMKKTFDLVALFGNLIGWKCSYDWTWKYNARHWFTIAYLIFTWSQILYTQHKHFANGEYKRIFEVFALYGIAISV